MAELTISAADIASALKSNLEGFEPSHEARTVGRVAAVGDGIARVSGLPDAAVNELLEFEDGSVGLALNLDETSIGAVVLGDVDKIEEGQTVKATGSILSMPVGDGMLGRVVNALGHPIDGGGDLIGVFRSLFESGHLEIATCAATHAFLPFVRERAAARGQIATAVRNFEKHFGRRPRGMWLPECAYAEGLDELLASEGIEYTFLDTHGLLFADIQTAFHKG